MQMQLTPALSDHPHALADERRYYARSFGNPSAQLYWHADDALRCGLSAERAAFFRDPAQNSLLTLLVRQGYLAPFDAVSPTHTEYSLVLRLVKTPRVSYCYEWTTGMWRQACLHLLRLMTILAERHLTLRYPHPWHLLFDGAKPMYINPGSIAPLTEATFRGAFDRLSQFFIRPLLLAASGSVTLARRFLRDSRSGVDLHVGELQCIHNRHLAELSALEPVEFLRSREKEICALRVPEPFSRWTEYQRELPLKPCDAWHRKEFIVHSILRELRPKQVLDLACNLGWYARLAAIEGAEVIATDIDETCANRMYSTIREEHSAVLPLVMDVTDPAPGYGVGNSWFPPATLRLQSDLVMAFAIVHHLVFGSHRLVMSEIVRALAPFARRFLLMEFVPLNSPGCVYCDKHRPDAVAWYNLEHCVGSLTRVFRKVELLPARQRARRLILCER